MYVWVQIAIPKFEAKLLNLRQRCIIREVEMECCTFLFIYLLVHTSIQQVRRENANDAGTARRRGAGGAEVESRGETRWQTTCLDELVLVFEAELHILE